MAQHTPGPWAQRAGHPCDVEAPESGHVATCETAEEARLIAAAPDMLEALREIQKLAARITRRADARRIGCEAGRVLRMVEGH